MSDPLALSSEEEHQQRKEKLPKWLQNNLQTKCVMIF